MKSLQKTILEKLKIHKSTAERLSKEQLDMLFVYCMCYLGDKNLYKEAISSGNRIEWGEMGTYSDFGIDWFDEKYNWISEYSGDNLAEHIISLMKLIIKYFDTNTNNYNYSYNKKFGMFKMFLFYILGYIHNENNDILDLTKLDNVTIKINKRVVYYVYDKDKIWSDIIKDKNIINICQEIYDTAKTLII